MKKFLIIILFFTTDFLFSQSVVINEVMSSNDTTIYDEDDDASDWIELYNSGSDSVNLKGCYLSDDSLNIEKWQFGDARIEPGKYLIIFASDKDTFINYWHTNFKISASGEEIIFSDSNGVVIDRVDVPASLEADGNGSTLELIDAGKDNSVAENWNTSKEHGTPGRINSVVVTKVEKYVNIIPKEFSLSQNYPNPFNPSTNIGFDLPFPGKVKVTVYNQLGQLIATIADGQYSAGTHQLHFKAGNLASGK
ncbi:MAG: lamin tail domain-containing protein [Ignavibacteriaceae bacterium]